MKDWTYGCEHELADWSRDITPPAGWGIDRREVTMVNSNGIAVDPKARVYRFGGELNTPPTASPDYQADMMREVWLRWPNATVNYRSALHVHVRVPGLREDLDTLKRIAQFNATWLPKLLPLINPIPHPEGPCGLRVYRWRTRMQHTVVRPDKLERQLAAKTLYEFLAAECPRNARDGVMWHAAVRHAVNLRQLRETDTIEFRHFPGTLSANEIYHAVQWCRDWLELAMNDGNPLAHWQQHYNGRRSWPRPSPFHNWMELRYRATTHDGSVAVADIVRNIELIFAGQFDGMATPSSL